MSTQLSEDPDVPQNIEPICGVKRKSEDASSELDIKKIKQGQKELRPGFGSDRFGETEYYFQYGGYLLFKLSMPFYITSPLSGLRKVYPYYFTYTTFCKGRWIGHLLVDVFTREFRAQSRELYVR